MHMFLEGMVEVVRVFIIHSIHLDIRLKKRIIGVGGGGNPIKLQVYIKDYSKRFNI